MNRILAVCAGVVLVLAAMGLAPQSTSSVFDFKDPKGVNALAINLDSELEPMIGTASGIAGSVSFDPADPAKASGALTLETRTIRMSNDNMTKVLHNADWLDVEKHSAITVNLKKVTDVKAGKAGVHTLTFDGDVTVKGQTKPMTFTVEATHLAGRAGDRMPKGSGDLLVLRTRFVVKRSDFGIKVDAPATVVADEIQISGGIVGIAAAK
jgi:polyisoprenoid-binding protein YceI